MSKTPSSVAWLNSKYSRTKGRIARTTERIKEAEARLELHRHKAQRCEEKLAELRRTLVRAETQALQWVEHRKL